MEKTPITLQTLISDFWQSCAEVIGNIDVTAPDASALPPEQAHQEQTLPTEVLPDGVLQGALESLEASIIDQVDRSDIGQELKKFDQLTGQSFTHTLEAAEDSLLGRMHTSESAPKAAATPSPSAVAMPAPVPLAQLTREAAMRFAQGAGFAQITQDEPVEKTEEEKEEDGESSLSEKNVQKLIRLGRLKSF